MSVHDSRKSISGMPNEVLLWLFQLLASDGSVSSQGARACIGRVCKRWRNISRLNRSLWTLIIIDIEEPEEDPKYFSSESDSESSESSLDVDDPDVSFLDQSLYLSHPLPLDIRVAYRRYSSEHLSYDRLVSSILMVLTRYSIRWRTFDWTSPTSYVSMILNTGLRDSTVLEALSLRCNDLNATFWARYMISIMLGTRTSHIEVTFDMSFIETNWANLTSLTAGFTHSAHCHQVLSSATGLHTLFLTHLGLEEAEALPREPTILTSIRHLKLTPCAVLGFLDQFRFPQVDQLSLAEPSEEFFSHMLKRSGGCPNMSIDNYDVERLCTTLELPGNPRRIGRLNIDWFLVSCTHLSTLSPLLRLFETSITSLHIEFGRRGGLFDSHTFFRSLVISDKTPLLPNLSELHLTETRGPAFGTSFAGVYQGNAFENMVLSRCNSSNVAAIPVLRVLRLHSNVSTIEPERFIMSSLCLNLQSLSSTDVPAHERLDVEWMLGGLDILREGREHARTLY